MSGYYNFSMSNNVREAHRSGEMPMSKWTKKAILARLEEEFDVTEEHMMFFKSISLEDLRDKLLVYCGWHHTSKFYNVTDFYDVEYDEDEDYYDDIDLNDNVFMIDRWWTLSYSKKRRAFRSITIKQFETAKEKHRSRDPYVRELENPVEEYKRIMLYFATIPYVYEGDGFDGYNKYQRPSSNGIGYVAICPGDRGNNFYTENKYAVKALIRKYQTWKENNPGIQQV